MSGYIIFIITRSCQTRLTNDCDPPNWSSELDAKTLELRHAFQTVQAAILRKINSSNPANSIPNEILTEIISYNDFGERLKASWVCSKWRMAAIENPRLWNVIDQKVQPCTTQEKVNGVVSLLVERSGAVPLVLNFNLIRDGTEFYNNNPPIISNLLERAGYVQNLATSSFHQYTRTMPLLRFLHLCISDGYPLEDHLDASIDLCHLSVELAGRPLPRVSSIPITLRKLQLLGIPNTPNAVLEIICRLPLLEELVVDGDTNAGAVVEEEAFDRGEYVLPPLRLLSLKNLSPHFLIQFFRNISISGKTNVYVEPVPMQGEVSNRDFYRGEETVGIWVDISKHTITCKHTESLTQFVWTDSPNPIQTFAFPSFVRLRTVQSISISGITLQHSIDLRPFANLRRLLLAYSPFTPIAETTPFTSTMFHQLGSTCPQLKYIGLRLDGVDSTGEDGVINKAADGLLVMMDDWMQHTGRRFERVVVDGMDKIDSWNERMTSLQSRACSFELGTVSPDEGLPIFPVLTSPLPNATVM